MKRQSVLVLVAVLFGMANIAPADMIQGINIEFITIGNAGNPGDTRAEANPYGSGFVNYEYRIGKYEVANAQWNAFTLAVGVPTGNPSTAYDASTYWTGKDVPTNQVSWYEAAQFCNYLTSGDKSLGAYIFGNRGDFIGIDRAMAQAIYGTIYVLPTEDEWYKAAYYTGSGYSLYANGLDTIPTADNGWNYLGGSYSEPWDVGTGTQEQNGTYDMMGNVWEWNEMQFGSLQGVRGGSFHHYDYILSSSIQGSNYAAPGDEVGEIGFRVVEIVSVPSAVILGSLGLTFSGWMLHRRGCCNGICF
jgi:formylglycine-generating enzyme required for sulfatase activity